MKEFDHPVLCGGTFFTLLLQFKKQIPKARERIKGKSSKLTEPNMLIGLIKVCYPEYTEPTTNERKSFKSMTSKYKNCTQKESELFAFSNPVIAKAFMERVENDYRTSLEAMNDFTNSFINTASKDIYIQLIELLLDLIELDRSIEGNDKFFMLPNGKVILKAEFHSFLDDSSVVCLPAFLLGIWHFIIANREDNSIGRATIEKWGGDPVKNWSREGLVSVGEKTARQIKVRVDIPIDSVNTHDDLEEPKQSENGNVVVEDKIAISKKTALTKKMLNIFTKAVRKHEIAKFLTCDNLEYSEGINVFVKKIKSTFETYQVGIQKTIGTEEELFFKKIAEFITALDGFNMSISIVGSNCRNIMLLNRIKEEELSIFEKSVLYNRREAINSFSEICIDNNLSYDDINPDKNYRVDNPFTTQIPEELYQGI